MTFVPACGPTWAIASTMQSVLFGHVGFLASADIDTSAEGDYFVRYSVGDSTRGSAVTVATRVSVVDSNHGSW